MKIFTPEFNELIRQTESELSNSDKNTLPPLHTHDELFTNASIPIDSDLHDTQLSDIRFHAGSIAAAARSRDLKLDAVIGWTRRHKDWLIWAERVEYPQSKFEWGVVHATVLSKNGTLQNIQPVVVEQGDIPAGINTHKELDDEQISKIIRRIGSSTTEVDLGITDINYETHIQHLATWVVKNSLHIPKTSDLPIKHYADTFGGYLAYEDDITNGIHRD